MLTLVLGGVVLLLVWFTFRHQKPPNLPPGLWGWPIIGTLPSGKSTLGDQVKELRKKYGDIISWKIGSRLFIFLCDYKLIKTAFSRPEASDRPDFYSLQSTVHFGVGGIASSNGLVWHNSRRFTLRHLKDLGMGKTFLGEAIEKEAGFLIEDLKKHVGRPGPLPKSLNIAILNVIWLMVAGKRYDINSKRITKFSELILEASASFEGPVILLDLFPVLISIIPFWLRTKLGMNVIYDNTTITKKYVMEEILKEHIDNFDRNDPKDYIDDYLLEMENQKDDPNSTMNMEDLSNNVMELFGAGFMATALTIKWAILYLMKYPDVQKKAQEQIDSLVPRTVLPTLQHRENLPYVDAITHEIARLASVTPLGVPHFTSEIMQLGGYEIPKNTLIFGHQECCHKDPSYWKKPNEFYPQHFLDETGKFFVRKEGFLPFSVGRRLCVGESLARMELYLFMAALLQNFTFSAPEGEKLSLEKNPNERIITFPKPYNVIITNRK